MAHVTAQVDLYKYMLNGIDLESDSVQECLKGLSDLALLKSLIAAQDLQYALKEELVRRWVHP